MLKWPRSLKHPPARPAEAARPAAVDPSPLASLVEMAGMAAVAAEVIVAEAEDAAALEAAPEPKGRK